MVAPLLVSTESWCTVCLKANSPATNVGGAGGKRAACMPASCTPQALPCTLCRGADAACPALACCCHSRSSERKSSAMTTAATMVTMPPLSVFCWKSCKRSKSERMHGASTCRCACSAMRHGGGSRQGGYSWQGDLLLLVPTQRGPHCDSQSHTRLVDACRRADQKCCFTVSYCTHFCKLRPCIQPLQRAEYATRLSR